MKNAILFSLFLVFTVYAVNGCAQHPNAEHSKEWRSYNGSPSSNKCSSLQQINKSDIADLELAWIFNTIPEPGEFGYDTWPKEAYKTIGGANNWLTIPLLTFSQGANDAIEPTVKGEGFIDLLEGGTLDAWDVPSDHWYLKEKRIVGYTGEEELEIPEWIYTKQPFSDFEFTCEMRLTGDNSRNTGIYYRVNRFTFSSNNGRKSYEAPSGYEFDAAYYTPGKTNYRGSLGDWYARPSLRIFPDQSIINQVYKQEEWNRLTIRARGNRLEYWINGIKVMDYIDQDPQASDKGVIGFQIHNGSVMKVEFRNIRVLPLNNPI